VRLERCKGCGDMAPVAAMNMDMHCEDCSLICEVCSKPHYNCKDFNYEQHACGTCIEKEGAKND
jgi:hypothetical protein